MLKIKQDKNEFEIINILEMVQIIYNDGKMDIFKAVQITDEGVYTGRIRNHNEFIDGGFIPKQNIKKIIDGIERKIRKRKSNF
ncbi:MAG: hypothetical protein AYK22_08210 [Thermoplasmatales archaeon SG8-52-3]|nr:MAG: hypothetical protein AYK22_08210 [Thermoplasmatales archaeon SG8-52-3]